MFTGLVESTGRVLSPATPGQDSQLLIDAGDLAGELQQGDSLAVNGCCLTATDIDPSSGEVSFDLLAQTLRVTNLGDLESGSLINLERALRADQRLGGHFVQGHVDATSTVEEFSPVGDDWKLTVSIPDGAKQYFIPKGSIAIDGISLTVSDVTPTSFSIAIIPHTHAVTAMGQRQVGDTVNLEADVLAKYVERLVRPSL